MSIAVVVSVGIDHVDDIEPAEVSCEEICAGSMAGGDSCTSTISRTSCWCEMATSMVGARRDLNVGLHRARRNLLFRRAADRCPAGSAGKLAASGEVGLAAELGRRRRLEGNAGGGNRDSVFVAHSDTRRGLGRGSAGEGERKKENTHAGQKLFYRRIEGDGAGFEI